jgi:hypothetical protein
MLCKSVSDAALKESFSSEELIKFSDYYEVLQDEFKKKKEVSYENINDDFTTLNE